MAHQNAKVLAMHTSIDRVAPSIQISGRMRLQPREKQPVPREQLALLGHDPAQLSHLRLEGRRSVRRRRWAERADEPRALDGRAASDSASASACAWLRSSSRVQPSPPLRLAQTTAAAASRTLSPAASMSSAPARPSAPSKPSTRARRLSSVVAPAASSICSTAMAMASRASAAARASAFHGGSVRWRTSARRFSAWYAVTCQNKKRILQKQKVIRDNSY